jgi:hypothetical protein
MWLLNKWLKGLWIVQRQRVYSNLSKITIYFHSFNRQLYQYFHWLSTAISLSLRVSYAWSLSMKMKHSIIASKRAVTQKKDYQPKLNMKLKIVPILIKLHSKFSIKFRVSIWNCHIPNSLMSTLKKNYMMDSRQNSFFLPFCRQIGQVNRHQVSFWTWF